MLLTKLKTATAVVMVTAVLTLSAAGGFYKAAAGDKPQAETSRPATRPAADVQQATTPADTQLPQSFTEPVSSEAGKNELPTTPMPRQALVRLEKRMLSMETLDLVYEPFTRWTQGRYVTAYQQVEIRKTRRYPAEIVHVYDMKGKRIDAKQLPKLVKKEIVALFSSDERAADPLNLRLFKEGTLLFVLSSAAPPPAPPSLAPAVAYPPDAPISPPPPAPAAIPYAPTIRLAPVGERVPAGSPVPPPAPSQPKAPPTVSPGQR